MGEGHLKRVFQAYYVFFFFPSVNKEETDRVRGTLAQLESDLAKLDEEEAELRNKHDELARRLADVQVDRREEERMQRRLETVEKLKGLCPGVVRESKKTYIRD